MVSKITLAALAAAATVKQAAAAHGHQHAHPDKRAIHWAETDTVIVTDWYTVYVTPGGVSAADATTTVVSKPTKHHHHEEPTTTTTLTSSVFTTTTVLLSSVEESTSSSSSTPVVVVPTTTVKPTTPAPAPTTLITSSIAPSVAEVTTTTPAPAPTTTSSAESSPTSGSSSGSSGAGKRGLVFTDPSLVTEYLALGGEATWGYNWAPSANGLEDSGIQFCPMLWGTDPDHTNGFAEAAEKAVANRTPLLSFNEPDIDTQANMTPAEAAQQHQNHLNQYSGKTDVSAPAISSSEDANRGLDWFRQWKEQCNGNCAFDFCAGHWYGPGDKAGADLFLNWVTRFIAACDDKPVWITEFQAQSGDVGAFLDHSMKQMENNASFAMVERYSYFYLQPGFLFDSTTQLSSYGSIYAGLTSL